jgi:hypothetical protein
VTVPRGALWALVAGWLIAGEPSKAADRDAAPDADAADAGRPPPRVELPREDLELLPYLELLENLDEAADLEMLVELDDP